MTASRGRHLSGRIDDLRQRLIGRIDAFEQKLSGRIDGMGLRFENLGNRFELFGRQLEALERRLSERLDAILVRIDDIDERTATNAAEAHATRVERVSQYNEILNAIRIGLQVRSDLDALAERIERIERRGGRGTPPWRGVAEACPANKPSAGRHKSFVSVARSEGEADPLGLDIRHHAGQAR